MASITARSLQVWSLDPGSPCVCVGSPGYCSFLPEVETLLPQQGANTNWEICYSYSVAQGQIEMGDQFISPFSLEVQYPMLSALNDSTRRPAILKSTFCHEASWMPGSHIMEFMKQRLPHSSVYLNKWIKIFNRHLQGFAKLTTNVSTGGCSELYQRIANNS